METGILSPALTVSPRRLELGQRNHAFGLVADIEEDRFAGDRDHGAFEPALCPLRGAVGVRLFVLRKNIAERLVGLVVGLGSRSGGPIRSSILGLDMRRYRLHCGIIPTGISHVSASPTFPLDAGLVRPQDFVWLLLFGRARRHRPNSATFSRSSLWSRSASCRCSSRRFPRSATPRGRRSSGSS